MTIFSQFMAQLKSVVFTFVYSGVLSFILLKLVRMLTGGLRASEEEEYNLYDCLINHVICLISDTCAYNKYNVKRYWNIIFNRYHERFFSYKAACIININVTVISRCI